MASPPAYDNDLKTMLQSAIQSVKWTYSLFWQLCPQRGMLVWKDGCYNGAIKTRKMVQPREVSTEEASLNRSDQLKALYDSLAAGDHQTLNQDQQQQPAMSRPSAALLPEDLTDSEWFYLMCPSFSFAPGDGSPGEAYAKQQHVWLTGAHEVDSEVFSRAILAKAAHLQTVVCIPLLNGVVELGTTEMVEEDIEFIQHVKSFFKPHYEEPISIHRPPKPSLSAHSSNTILSPQMPALFYTSFGGSPYNMEDDHPEEEEYEEGNGLDSEAETGHLYGVHDLEDVNAMAPMADHAELEPYEPLPLDTMSEDLQLGSPNDASNNLDSVFNLLASSQAGAHQLEELTQEDTHCSHTVSTVLVQNSDSYSADGHHAISSTQSSFSTWTEKHHQQYLHGHRHHAVDNATNSQRILKYILFTVPYLHSNTGDSAATCTVASRLRRGTSHDVLSANHVLAERRRREKLNERFMILRSLVPVVTKMDKASILGDTIEYLKQLRQKIQDLEARASETNNSNAAAAIRTNKRKFWNEDEIGSSGSKTNAVLVPGKVDVSIIESDALVELRCQYREGLLLDVMRKLREFGVEIITVQSSLDDGMCTAEMRARVKEKVKGERLGIMQVKRAIIQIVSIQLH